MKNRSSRRGKLFGLLSLLVVISMLGSFIITIQTPKATRTPTPQITWTTPSATPSPSAESAND